MLARIAATERSDPINITVNNDESINISAVNDYFPNCVGIRYRCHATGNLKATHVINDQFYLPQGVSWSDYVFHCVFKPVEDNGNKIHGNERKGADKQSCFLNQYDLETFDMIVFALPDSITENSLRLYFSKFGPLKLCQLKRRSGQRNSKPYGFLRYDRVKDQHECIRVAHVIDRCPVSLRLPTAKIDSASCRRKLFITNITPSVGMEEILEYFSVFGKITQIFMPPVYAPYAFVTFKSEQSISRIFQIGESHRVFGGYVLVAPVHTRQEMEHHIDGIFDPPALQNPTDSYNEHQAYPYVTPDNWEPQTMNDAIHQSQYEWYEDQNQPQQGYSAQGNEYYSYDDQYGDFYQNSDQNYCQDHDYHQTYHFNGVDMFDVNHHGSDGQYSLIQDQSYDANQLKDLNQSGQSIDKSSDTTAPMVGEVEIQNDRDILVQLLIDRVVPSLPTSKIGNGKRVTTTNMKEDKMAKVIRLLQNPMMLDNIIRLSEDLGLDKSCPEDKKNGS